MEMRPLAPDTLEATVALAMKIFPDENPERALRASLDPVARQEYLGMRNLTDFAYLVAQDERGVAGVTGIYGKKDDPTAAWVGWFGVDPDRRREGIGSELLDAVIDAARARGAKRVRLYTSDDESEAAAQVLYENRGFRVINEVPDIREGFSYLYRELALEPEAETQPMHYELVTDPEDARVLGAHALMGEIFDPSETDPLDVTQEALRDGGYILVTGKEEGTDTIVAAATGKNLALRAADGTPEQSSFLCGCYIAAKEPYRRIGVGLRLFHERLSRAMEDAKTDGQEFLGYLAEGSEAEEFFNRVYARRMYIQTSPGVFEEIPYYQPPTEWNEQGFPVKTAPDGSTEPFEQYDAPEHLVFAPAPAITTDTLPPNQVMGMLRGMFSYNSRENAFSTDGGAETLARLNTYVDRYEEELAAFLQRSCDGIVHLIAARQRTEREKNGGRFVPHPGIQPDAE